MTEYYDQKIAVVKMNEEIIVMFGTNSFHLSIGQAKVLCMKIFNLVVRS